MSLLLLFFLLFTGAILLLIVKQYMTFLKWKADKAIPMPEEMTFFGGFLNMQRSTFASGVPHLAESPHQLHSKIIYLLEPSSIASNEVIVESRFYAVKMKATSSPSFSFSFSSSLRFSKLRRLT